MKYDVFMRYAEPPGEDSEGRVGVIHIARILTPEGFRYHIGDVIHLCQKQMIGKVAPNAVLVEEIEFDYGSDGNLIRGVIGVTTNTYATIRREVEGVERVIKLPSILMSEQYSLDDILGGDEDG